MFKNEDSAGLLNIPLVKTVFLQYVRAPSVAKPMAHFVFLVFCDCFSIFIQFLSTLQFCFQIVTREFFLNFFHGDEYANQQTAVTKSWKYFPEFCKYSKRPYVGSKPNKATDLEEWGIRM